MVLLDAMDEGLLDQLFGDGEDVDLEPSTVGAIADLGQEVGVGALHRLQVRVELLPVQPQVLRKLREYLHADGTSQAARPVPSHKHAQSHTSHTRDADTCTDCSCLEALDRTVLRSKNALTIAAALASTFSPTYLMSASCR